MGHKSDLTLGYYDKERFDGEIHWNPIEFEHMFAIKLDKLMINNKDTGLCGNSTIRNCTVTFDSGTSFIFFPSFATIAMKRQGLPLSYYIKKCESETEFGSM